MGRSSGADRQDAEPHLSRSIPRWRSDCSGCTRTGANHQRRRHQNRIAGREFSSVVSFTMLHHVPTVELQDRLFAEAFRVLRPVGFSPAATASRRCASGFCISATPATPSRRTPCRIRLRAAGFGDVESRFAGQAALARGQTLAIREECIYPEAVAGNASDRTFAIKRVAGRATAHDGHAFDDQFGLVCRRSAPTRTRRHPRFSRSAVRSMSLARIRGSVQCCGPSYLTPDKPVLPTHVDAGQHGAPNVAHHDLGLRVWVNRR